MSDDEGDARQAYILIVVIVLFALIAYFANNPYELWSATAPAYLALVAYYYLTQPIYIAFLVLFTYEVYKQDESLGSAARGFIAANLAMIGLDIMGLPYAVMSITNPSQTLTLQANPLVTPFADYQLISLFAGSQGVVTMLNDIFVHVGLPLILIVAAFVIARPSMFVQIMERS